MSIGLPENRQSDGAVRDAIALYANNITISRRTLIASLESWHDFSMAIEALDQEDLLAELRWVNFGDDK